MKKHLLTIAMIGILGISVADAQKYKYDWMKMITFDREMVSLYKAKMYADDSGNTYSVFHFQWDIHLGRPPQKKKDPEPPILSSDGAYHGVFIEKRNADGEQVWSKVVRLGDGKQSDQLSELYNWNNDLSVANGEVYLTGSFDSSADFGDGVSLKAEGRSDMYIAKLKADGTAAWAIRAGGKGKTFAESDAGGMAILASKSGGVYALGMLNAYPKGGGTVGDEDLGLSKDGMQSVLFKVSGDGKIEWNKKAAAGTFFPISDMDADDAGNLYLSGAVQFFAEWQGNKTTANGMRDAVIMKLNAEGDHVWTKVMGWGNGAFDGKNLDNETVNVMSVASNGDITALVTLFNGAQVGDIKIKTEKDNITNLETLIINLNSDGEIQRTTRFAGPFGSVPNSIVPGYSGQDGLIYFSVGKKAEIGGEKLKNYGIYSCDSNGEVTHVMGLGIPELKGVYAYSGAAYCMNSKGTLFSFGDISLMSDLASQFAGSAAGKRLERIHNKKYIYDRDFDQGIVVVQYSN